MTELKYCEMHVTLNSMCLSGLVLVLVDYGLPAVFVSFVCIYSKM